jgi:hypothetical protein
MIDRRPAQRARRAGFRQRLPIAWAGFRGAVSLAAAAQGRGRGCGPNETPDSLLRRDAELEAELRSALLADKRNAVIKLRDQRRIDDIVLRRIQGRLDREEVRLADSALEDD